MKRVVLGLIAALALALSACGGKSLEDLCREICECEEGSRCLEEEVGICVDQGNEASDAAKRAGCSKEFNRLVSCVASEGECVRGEYDFICATELVELDRCDDRRSSLDTPSAKPRDDG